MPQFFYASLQANAITFNLGLVSKVKDTEETLCAGVLLFYCCPYQDYTSHNCYI